MNIAYLMNTYPITSTTFVKNEIHALEQRGLDIKRYAVRKWDQSLVDEGDIQEISKTTYLLKSGFLKLMKSFITEVFLNLKGIIRVFPVWFQLLLNSRFLLVHHVAYLLEAVRLRQLTKKDNIGHIHVHFSTNSTAVALLCRCMGGPTYSFTVHGPDEFDAPQLSSLQLKIDKSKFVVAITEFCKSQLIRYSNFSYWQKIKVYRCGIVPEYFSDFKPVSEENRRIVCVGRLSTLKGQLLLPEVVSKLKHRHPGLELVIVGDGPCRKDLEAAIKKFGVEDNFILQGWLSNKEVRETISSSRALVLPSFAEGLPIVFMEALALARPAIGTYIAGIPELIDEKCGWLVPAGSARQLEEAFDSLLNTDTDTINKMGMEGRARVLEHHNIHKLAANLYREFTG